MKKKYILYLTGIVLFSSCISQNNKLMVIGHRGAMGHETENTLASVQKALDLGVDMIEIDVFRIVSGEIVVFHDERVERLANGGGRIEEYNIVDLKQLILDGNHKIPMLQEVLRLIDNKVRLNIELKGANTADRVNFITGKYIENNGWAPNNFLISSFNWDELKKTRELNKEMAIAVLTDGDPLEAIPIAKELKAESINPNFEKLDVETVKQIHDAGFKVYTWTVNSADDIERIKNMGVDGIFTNFPERAH
ncbi:glycerophosphodiester phosphodiesterase [Spongiimicrobium sp. 3-5]|uniref:glycerophosphodiester phosphodiesterase n=1 Tax=Spongiimicrobium sp. 3-5 TaxID=3332596 RepID=UPI003980DD74